MTTAVDSNSAPAGSTSTEVEQGVAPLQLDVGFMTSVDPNPINFKQLIRRQAENDDAGKQAGPSSQRAGSILTAEGEAYLLSRARNSTQHLLNSIFSLPFTKNPDVGPLVTLPPIQFTSRICEPREKPLPKPGGKALTKWEQFAKTKGIQHVKKDKMVWDDDKKEWVARWGFKGQNKNEEEQWIHEMPASAGKCEVQWGGQEDKLTLLLRVPDNDYNPAGVAKKARKERKTVNESKRLKNLQRSAATAASSSSAKDPDMGGNLVDPKAKREGERAVKKAQLEGDILRSKRSTASMGNFDRTLPQEGKAFKVKGIKRKFEPTEKDVSAERSNQLDLLNKLDRKGVAPGRSSFKGRADGDLVNARKAVKFASGGRGTAALAAQSDPRKKPKGAKKGR